MKVKWRSDVAMKGNMVLMHNTYLVKYRFLNSLYFLLLPYNSLCSLSIVVV
jgi:hypothetical protein